MWKLEYSAEADHDFELIFSHLYTSYVDLGDNPDAALNRAADRIRGIKATIDRLPASPYIGTLQPRIRHGLRFVRLEKAAVWFYPDEDRKVISVIAVFFGAQDHVQHMLTRLLPE